ncbi:MAG TPA: DnaA/Hda family protein [Gemmatimonadales bacterium]|jgi:chromosomal replication initiation ATPase DnaA
MALLNPHARFASFVVGSSNRLAATAAKTVAEAPGAAYNPLFFYARPGLGKTHLLSAIGHEAQTIDPSRVVEYVTVDDFVEAYHTALAAGQAEAYRRRFTDAHLVLLDDAQLLSDQRELQSELLRLIDLLMAADRQIVLASDRPPEEIQSLDERLIRRFAGGLVIDIGAPDYETRLAILARRATERQTTFAPEVLATVAELPITTVRELLGALNRLIAQQAVAGAPVGVAEARRVLAALGHGKASPAPVLADLDLLPPPAAPGIHEEFTSFLSDVSTAVSQQVDRWRQRVTEAALRLGGEGFHTGRLDALLAREIAVDPAAALAAFEADVDLLRQLQAEIALLAPTLLMEAALHDPDRVAEAELLVVEARESGEPLPAPLARYTLAQFAEGSGTRPVVEAIRTVAEGPGQRYNPLVIVGKSGVGKTHLLHALGHALKATGLNRVAVFDGKDFVDGLVTALGDGTIARWRQRLRRADAFLLDDVGVLAGKERSQEELYLLYNLMLESGRQMAFTASVTPAHLTGFEPRLATRLAGGLVVELGPPDRDARIHEATRLLGVGVADPDLIEYLAARPAGSLRELQQLIQRLVAAAEQRETALTMDVARAILEGNRVAIVRQPRRSSGLLAPGSGAIRSREKMIETWPDISERMLEEWT